MCEWSASGGNRQGRSRRGRLRSRSRLSEDRSGFLHLSLSLSLNLPIPLNCHVGDVWMDEWMAPDTVRVQNVRASSAAARAATVNGWKYRSRLARSHPYSFPPSIAMLMRHPVNSLPTGRRARHSLRARVRRRTSQLNCRTLPRFYRDSNKGENGQIGDHHDQSCNNSDISWSCSDHGEAYAGSLPWVTGGMGCTYRYLDAKWFIRRPIYRCVRSKCTQSKTGYR
jgi:hypothetical protein